MKIEVEFKTLISVVNERRDFEISFPKTKYVDFSLFQQVIIMKKHLKKHFK